MPSKFKMPTTARVAERPLSWIVRQLYSDLASRLTRGRRAGGGQRVAHPSVARRQSAGAVSGLETKRSALVTHLSVNTNS